MFRSRMACLPRNRCRSGFGGAMKIEPCLYVHLLLRQNAPKPVLYIGERRARLSDVQFRISGAKRTNLEWGQRNALVGPVPSTSRRVPHPSRFFAKGGMIRSHPQQLPTENRL